MLVVSLEISGTHQCCMVGEYYGSLYLSVLVGAVPVVIGVVVGVVMSMLLFPCPYAMDKIYRCTSSIHSTRLLCTYILDTAIECMITTINLGYDT